MLTNPAGGIGSRSVDLGKVLSGESSSTVSSPTTIGIDNDLATGQASITLGTTNDEAARGLNLLIQGKNMKA